LAQVTASNSVRISTLEEGKHYPVAQAQRQQTVNGSTVMLTLRTSDSHKNIKIFLPKRYSLIFKDEYIQKINNGTCCYHLRHHGLYPNSRAFKLTLEQI
jgi:hypothetical protein